jgi:hypothetical protein
MAALLLPAMALAAVQTAILTRVTRSAVLDTLREDFVRTARAKGVSSLGVVIKHALPNAAVPMLMFLGIEIGHILAATQLLFDGQCNLPFARRCNISQPFAGLVIAQEIFGVNANLRQIADHYAEAGYLVLVPDLFWRQQPGVQLGYTPEDWQRAFQFFQSQ